MLAAGRGKSDAVDWGYTEQKTVDCVHVECVASLRVTSAPLFSFGHVKLLKKVRSICCL